MRFRKKKTKVEDIGAMDETPEDETFFKEEAKRNLEELCNELIERTKRETELIRQHLGIDDRGCCLRHPNQFITDKVLPNRRFETIKICLICDSELKAGGKAQRKSMTNVISDLNTLIEDKTAWRNKTSVMYNGQIPEEEEENEEEENAGTTFKKWEPANPEVEHKDFSHMLKFYNPEVEEEQAKARKKSFRKKKKAGDDESEDISAIIEHEDVMWKEEVKQRVAHVRAWDGDMALKQNPVYAKYFRMVNVGIPMQGIQQAMEMDGLDIRIMSLDPNRPLQDQVDDIPDMSEEERETLRRGDQLALMRDDDIFEPLTIDETVEMIHRAYERRAYFMQELEDERNPEKRKLQKKLMKKLGKGRAPPPPLIEPKRRELPPKPEEEGKGEEEEEENKIERRPAPSPRARPASSPLTVDTTVPPKRSSRGVSWSNREQVTTTEDIDSSLRGEPRSQSRIHTPSSVSSTHATMGTPRAAATPSPKGGLLSADTADSQPPVLFPEPDDKLPGFYSDEELLRISKKRRPFKPVTKLGATKYAVARTKEELAQAEKELLQRTVITNSLKTQLERLQKALEEADMDVEDLQHELYQLDPADPLCTRPSKQEEKQDEDGPSSPFKNVDRSDVVKARMSKLSIMPRTLPR
ncbi:unnamed protein product [Cylindrotheca closterium]|uniref:Uncharacterized protein n=1 Tax=Cylindrotheca closterium TaxID=2856 RepID=A0AAD2FIT2_9STRA|nr:unnamed protein product [Cylindrotheca closterium]